jgi:succinoglycan biosynthesis transport protein ExoP
MELRRLWLLVWHRRILVVVIVMASLVAGYETTPRLARYQTSATLFVGVPQYSSSGVFGNDVLLGQQQLAVTFATMVPTLDVVRAAVEETGVRRSPAAVIGETKASVISGTSLIIVTVTDPDPVVAQQLANGISNAFVQQMLKLDPVTSTVTGEKAASPAAPVSLSQEAVLPVAPISNGLARHLILSGLFGLLVAVGLVLLLDYLDLSARTPEDLERRTGLPVLGMIPLYPELSTNGLPGSHVVVAERTRL